MSNNKSSKPKPATSPKPVPTRGPSGDYRGDFTTDINRPVKPKPPGN